MPSIINRPICRMEPDGPVFLCHGTAWETKRTQSVIIGWSTDKVGPTVIRDEKTAKYWGVAISLESSMCSFEVMNQVNETLGKNRAHLLGLSSQAQASLARRFFSDAIELVKDDGTCTEARSKLRYLLDQLDQLDAWEAFHKRPERPDTPAVRALDVAISSGFVDGVRLCSAGHIGGRLDRNMTIEEFRGRGCRGTALIHGGGRGSFIASGVDAWNQDAYHVAQQAAELRDLKKAAAMVDEHHEAETIELHILRALCSAYQVTVHEVIPVVPGHPEKASKRRPGWYTKMRLIGTCNGVQVLRCTESRPTRLEALQLAAKHVGELREAGQIVTIGIDGLQPPGNPPGGAALNPWIAVPDERADCEEPGPCPVFVGVDVRNQLFLHAIQKGSEPVQLRAATWDDLRVMLEDLEPKRVVIDAVPAVGAAQRFARELTEAGIPTYLIRSTRPPAGVAPRSFKVDHEKHRIVYYGRTHGQAKTPQEVFAAVAANMGAPPKVEPKGAQVWCVEYLRGDQVGYVANTFHRTPRMWTRRELESLILTSDVDKARGFPSQAAADAYASGSEGILRACECQEVLPKLMFDADTVIADEVGPEAKIDPSMVSIGRCEVFIGPAGEKPTTSLGTLGGPIKLTVNKARVHPATALQGQCIQNAIEEHQVMIEFRSPMAGGRFEVYTCPSPRPRIDIIGCAPTLPPNKWTKIAEGPTEWDAYSRALIYLLKRT